MEKVVEVECWKRFAEEAELEECVRQKLIDGFEAITLIVDHFDLDVVVLEDDRRFREDGSLRSLRRRVKVSIFPRAREPAAPNT